MSHSNGIASAVAQSVKSGKPTTVIAPTVSAKPKGPQYAEAIKALKADSEAQARTLASIEAMLGKLTSVAAAAVDPAPFQPTGNPRMLASGVDPTPPAEKPAIGIGAVYPHSVPGAVGPVLVKHPALSHGERNAAAEESVAVQAATATGNAPVGVDGIRWLSPVLTAGVPMFRDRTECDVEIQERDRQGRLSYDADGQPVMKTTKAYTKPTTRAYLDATLSETMPDLHMAVIDGSGQIVSTLFPMRFTVSKNSGNPQYHAAAPSFKMKDKNGNITEWKAGSATGLYFGLREYQGAPLTEADYVQAERQSTFTWRGVA